ncbi:MAG TPA: hypothetical protein DCM87_18320, partial [Planctomycetes bacterium]|nr:hypothetical protein [Planctomycetota bacterium]
HVITPYTSFLVLESADDRRHFNVTRRAPPARAGDHEARVRAAMRDAVQWRDDLRAGILRLYGSIEDVVEPYAIANAVDMQSGAAVAALANASFVFSGGRHEGEPAAFTTWRGARRDDTESSPLLGRYSIEPCYSSFEPGYVYRDPSSDPDHDPDARLDDSQAAGLDTPGTLESRDEGADAGSPMDYPTPAMSVRSGVISDPLGPCGRSLRNPAPFALPTPLDFVYPCASAELLYYDHSGVRYGAYLRTNDVWWPSYRLHGLFPRILAPSPSLPAMWPPEITGVIAALDHRSAIARLEGGLRLRLSREIFDRGGASCPAGSSSFLLSRESWHATELPAAGELRTDAWCDAEERGACFARLLGTRRKSERGEAHAFPSPFQHYFDPLHGEEDFREGVPSLAIEGSRAVLSLSFLPRYDRCTSAAIAFDLERSCVTGIAWFSGNEEVRTESFSGFVRAGGAYWPAVIERRERGALTERVRIACEELTQDAHVAAAGEFRAALDDAVLFAFPLPPVAEAAERCRAGKGSWDDHWALIDRFVGRNAGDAVWSQFTEAEKLVQGKWGLRWLRLFVLALLGRDEEVRRCELGLAHELAARAPPEGPALAQALCAQQLFEPDSEDSRLSTGMHVSWGRASWDGGDHDPHEAALRTILAPLMAQIGESPRRAFAENRLDAGSVREVIGRDGIDAAVTHIERAAETRTSDSRAREDILSRGAQALLESGHERAFLALVEKWNLNASEHAGAELLAGYLGALAWFGREDEADRIARSWIAIDAAQDSSERRRARTDAALRYTLAFGESPSPMGRYVAHRFVAPLYDLARAASLQAGGGWIAQRVLGHDRDERMPETRALKAWVYERLQEGIESLPPAVLANLFVLTADCRPSPRQPSRSRLHARLLARWNGETDPVACGLLERLIISLGDADTVLSLRRRQLAAAEDPQVRMRLRGEICHLLLSSPWSRDVQEELLALIPQLGAGLDRFAIQADAVHSLAWYLTKGRALDALMERPDRFSKPRAELAALVRAARAEKRKEAIDTLAALEEGDIGAALAPFVRIERLTLEAIARTDVRKTAADLHALLEMLPETPERPDLALRYRLAADRCLLALGCLATGPRADAQVAARLRALLQERAARDHGLIDAKLHLFRFLLAAGRIEELRAQLAAWCRDLPPPEGDRWRPALADFHAAQGAFGEAIRVLSPLAERHGMQSHHYEALAAWHGILGDEAASRAARMRSLGASSDFALECLLEWNLRNLERTGRIDVEAARDVFVVLAGNRIRDPEPWSDVVLDMPVSQTEYFRETGDLRFLELAIAQHRPRSWQALEGCGGLLWHVLEPVEDLATLREVSAAADRARASAAGALDLCAADILDIVLARKAASLEGDTDSFVARGAAALRGLGRVKGNPEGVPAVAGFLASLGGKARLQGPLEQERLAFLGELHERAPAGSEARLALAEQYAGALWDAGRHIDAIDVLQELPIVPEDFPARMASSHDAAAVRRAEALLRDKLERAKTVADRRSCTARLARFHAAAIGPENRVRLAAAAEVYARAYRHSVETLRMTADTRWESFSRDRDFGPKAVFDLLERAQVLQLPAVREDARDFYLNVLPSFLGGDSYRFSDAYALRSYGEKAVSILGLKRFVETLADGAVRPPAEGGGRFRSALSAFAARRPSEMRRVLQEDAALNARILALALAGMRSDLETRFGDSRELLERYEQNPTLWMYKFPWLNVFDAGHAAAFHEVVTRFREEHADSPGAVIDAARVLAESLGREKEAVSLLLSLEEKGGLDAEGREFLARVLLQQNEPERAIPPLEACIRDDPGALAFHLLLIEACRKAREDARAAAAAQAAGADLRNAGNWDGEVAHKLAAACLDNELPAPAAAYARDAVSMLRGVDGKKASYLLVSAYETLIKAHAAQGDLMQAAEAAGEGFTVLRRSPRDREDLARLLEMILVARRREAASPEEGGRAPLAPPRAGDRDLESYVHMGERFAEAGDEDAAERAYTTLVELSALESEGHALLAKVREDRGRWDEARRHWRRVAEIRPYEPAGPLGEARCLIRMGSAGEARALLERVKGRSWPDRFDYAKDEARELLEQITAQKGAEASGGKDL